MVHVLQNEKKFKLIFLYEGNNWTKFLLEKYSSERVKYRIL